MESSYLAALAGGALIGASTALLLLSNGRIAGISGVVGGLFRAPPEDRAWRLAFVAGLVMAGPLLGVVAPAALTYVPQGSMSVVALAGLLVGFGTRYGSGCTSGHGVCGNARVSSRSLVATVTFLAVGVITVTLSRLAAA